MTEDSAWLYHHLGTIAQIAGIAALSLIGILSILRKRKGLKLAETQRKDSMNSHHQ